MSYYKILRVKSDATSEEIQKAAERMKTIWNPDAYDEYKEVARRVYEDVCKAEDVLTDIDKREMYDEEQKRLKDDSSENAVVLSPSGKCVLYERPWLVGKGNIAIMKEDLSEDLKEDEKRDDPEYKSPETASENLSVKTDSDTSFGISLSDVSILVEMQTLHALGNYTSPKNITDDKSGLDYTYTSNEFPMKSFDDRCFLRPRNSKSDVEASAKLDKVEMNLTEQESSAQEKSNCSSGNRQSLITSSPRVLSSDYDNLKENIQKKIVLDDGVRIEKHSEDTKTKAYSEAAKLGDDKSHETKVYDSEVLPKHLMDKNLRNNAVETNVTDPKRQLVNDGKHISCNKDNTSSAQDSNFQSELLDEKILNVSDYFESEKASAIDVVSAESPLLLKLSSAKTSLYIQDLTEISEIPFKDDEHDQKQPVISEVQSRKFRRFPVIITPKKIKLSSDVTVQSESDIGFTSLESNVGSDYGHTETSNELLPLMVKKSYSYPSVQTSLSDAFENCSHKCDFSATKSSLEKFERMGMPISAEVKQMLDFSKEMNSWNSNFQESKKEETKPHSDIQIVEDFLNMKSNVAVERLEGHKRASSENVTSTTEVTTQNIESNTPESISEYDPSNQDEGSPEQGSEKSSRKSDSTSTSGEETTKCIFAGQETVNVQVCSTKIDKISDDCILKCTTLLNARTPRHIDIQKWKAIANAAYSEDSSQKTIISTMHLKGFETVTAYTFGACKTDCVKVYAEGYEVCDIENGVPKDVDLQGWRSSGEEDIPLTMTSIIKADESVIETRRLREDGTEQFEVYKNGVLLHIVSQNIV